ncbi:MAG: hypothetical protein S4CHLAM123_12650 [Chlamydiales bacterium]|nr:hypothetical protein [Chlamydiales bacterium]
MTMTDNQLQLTDINEELKRLWDSELGENKIRASLFNLVLYVQKTERTEHYNTLIKSVVSKFPCRVILVISDENSTQEYLKTKVSSETIGQGELQIFCELIQIEVAGKLIERVPFIILPQILPDLPVYLLWTQDPATENTILPHLEPLADRIIFDSESTSDLQAYSKTVLSLMQRFHCKIGDLNWSALSGWRKIFTQVFDSEDSFQSLAQSNLIRINYNKFGGKFYKHTEIEAAYLQAWLASRLNWKFQTFEINEENVRLTYKRPTHEVIVLLTPQEDEGQPPGAILSIEIESLKDKGLYTFKRHPETRQVFIQYSEKDHCNLPYCTLLSGISEGQEIVEEIFYPSGGKHYLEMLTSLSNTPWRN